MLYEVLIDLDNTGADFDGAIDSIWKTRHKDKPLSPKDSRTHLYYAKNQPEEYAPLIAEIYNTPGFFRKLPEIPKFVWAVRRIQEERHHVVICTSPLKTNATCHEEKIAWVVEKLGNEFKRGGRIVITDDKTFVPGDLLIDDRPYKTPTDAIWTQVVFDRTWNRGPEAAGLRRLNGWANVMHDIPELFPDMK